MSRNYRKYDEADDGHRSEWQWQDADDLRWRRVAMVRPELILIGYWRGEGAEGWPDPHKFVDSSWDADEREVVVDYLGRGFVVRAYMGYSPCRICGRDNGSLELSDGVYVWPEGLAHYLADHEVRPPGPFVSHALAMMEAFESAGRDESWWRSIADCGNPLEP